MLEMVKLERKERLSSRKLLMLEAENLRELVLCLLILLAFRSQSFKLKSDDGS